MLRHPAQRGLLGFRLDNGLAGKQPFGTRGDIALFGAHVPRRQRCATDLVQDTQKLGLADPVEEVERGRTPPVGAVDLHLG